jgi:hypothetical protein
MPYFLCEKIGSGIDAEENAIRPALSLYQDTWTCVADSKSFGLMLVKSSHKPAFDADSRIKPMRKALLAGIAPVDSETDDWEAPDLAEKFARRFLLDQKGFGRGTSEGRLRELIPGVKVRLKPGKMSPSGTFTDNFTNGGSNTNLGSWTPSGGTAWTHVDGTSSWAYVHAGFDWLVNFTSDNTGASWRCDDQGSADHYTQWVTRHVTLNAFVCNRHVSRSSYIGSRTNVNVAIFRVDGAFTSLGTGGSPATGNTIRLESSGDSHEAFLNGASVVGPVNDAYNNTATRQGVNARSGGENSWLDNFEAGVLAGTEALTTSVSTGGQTAPSLTTSVPL